jgi:hypothetical protein
MTLPSGVRRLRRPLVRTIALTAAMIACGSGLVQAQNRLPRRGGAASDGVSPAEIQRLFDAYVVMQAQQELQLSDEQYPKFLARVKELQAVRQRALMQRGRILQALRRLDAAQSLDEAGVRAQLQALADADERSSREIRDAVAAIDQVLDARQQLRFRLFEEQMERRKVDLLLRARQANRQRNNP